MNGDELASLADRIMRHEVSVAEGISARMVTFLLRLALERELDDFWKRSGIPAMARNPMRAQLLCLGGLLSPGKTGLARSLWGQLSQACHYHTYELSPSAAELRRWHTELAQLTYALRSVRSEAY
ncbi:hypothetical protein [Actinomadura rupiterrae]|uniref:hypothetical protein n=1 Tax=Actinomadura rupiterrae TaxID=559627 RepID=UPI0020A5F061|nr:hypothetical protein [Actinomadura rupiterrae]MCP2339536.1 hypothetical protein [Actinomadura rupiterrae]